MGRGSGDDCGESRQAGELDDYQATKTKLVRTDNMPSYP